MTLRGVSDTCCSSANWSYELMSARACLGSRLRYFSVQRNLECKPNGLGICKVFAGSSAEPAFCGLTGKCLFLPKGLGEGVGKRRGFEAR